MSIYQQYFALSCEPFSIVPDPGFLYPSSQHRQAVAHLKYGLDREGGFVLLTGEVGTGKTTLTRTLIKRLPAHVRVAYVLNSTFDAADVLASICQELGIKLPKSSKTSLTKNCVDALNADLIESHAEGKKTLVVIEEAQNLSPEVLEILRLLSNLETATHKLLHILLVGQPELLETLAQKDQRQLNQRVVARFHLLPLEKTDVANYVNHRLHHAGANRAIFESSAMMALFKLTQGVPRLINLICHHALLAAYATGAKTVSAKLVKAAAVEIFDIEKPKQKSSGALGWSLVFCAVVALLAGAAFYTDQLPSKTLENAQSVEVPVKVESRDETASQPLMEVVESLPLIVEVESQPLILPIEPTGIILEPKLELKPPVFNNPFTALFALWSVEVEPLFSEEEVYSVATENDLGAEKLINIPLSDLIELDRAGIVWVQDDNNRLKSYVLTAIDSGAVHLQGVKGERQETLEWLAENWNGAFLYLWHRPIDILSLRLGDKNAVALDWLQSRLLQIEDIYQPIITGGYFNEAVRLQVLNFQQQQGIRADGVVGQQTIMKINELTMSSLPKLNSGIAERAKI
ncbi:AAA family ATPase [Porticoccaceae bacterium]|jgi:general secretion pathway protein A|nr:AAA family ATPase [Porticoccaceae bacterium]